MGARLLFPILLLALTLASTFAGPTVYHVRTEDSNIGFTIMKWLVFKEEGRFRDFSGVISFDKANPKSLAVEFSTRVASVDSRDRDRDEVIRSRGFFHATQYPNMTFKSTSVATGRGDTLLVTGDFTMRNVTKRITVPVLMLGTHKVRDLGELIGFEAEFNIDRTEFGIAPDMTMIGKEVHIHMFIGAASGGATARK